MIPKFTSWMQSISLFFNFSGPVFWASLTFFTLMSNTSLASPETQWQLQKSKLGIDVSQKPTASGYIEVKAETLTDGKPADFLALLEDISIAPEWISNCEKVRILAKPSENVRIVQTFFSAPWPVKDRDMVTQSTTTLHPNGEVTIEVVDASNATKNSPDHVRMQRVKGNWRLTPVSNNTMTVRYEGYGEPSGALPVWLANKLIVSSTFSTFEQLRRLLTKRTSS